MNRTTKIARPLFSFYLLVAYVLLQFVWWSYHMVKLNNEIYLLKSEINLLKEETADQVILKGNKLNEK